METTNNAFGTLCNALLGDATKPVKGAKGKAYTMGKSNYTEVDDGTDIAVEKGAKVSTPVVVKEGSTPSKADTVRTLIAEAKAAGDDANVVIARTVLLLNMARGQASTYVKNNWDRV